MKAQKKSVRRLHQAVGPDKNGVVGDVNINQSLSNLNVATANMPEDTEALKHNLLFRGFFCHRGYYNLADITADKYCGDKLFIDPGNYRAWLPAAEIFKKDSEGMEESYVKGRP